MVGSVIEEKGKYALITGGSSGIGKALAEALARRGKPVLLVALASKELEDTVLFIRQETGVNVYGLGIDLTEPGAAGRVLAWTREMNYPVDFLINNAGIGGAGRFSDIDPLLINSCINLNIKALTDLIYCFLPVLSSAGKSWILNVSSMAAFFDIPYKSLYSASKSYVLSLSRGLRAELAPKGVRVFVLSPNAVLTSQSVINRIEIHGKKMKFMQVTAEHLADRTLRLIEKDRFLIFQNRLDWLLYLGSRLLPKRLQSRMLCREFSKEVRAKRA